MPESHAFTELHLPVFALTWVIFLVAGGISFFLQIHSNRQTVSLSIFVKHCFPFEAWRTKSVRIDIIVYLAGKFIRKTYDFIGFLFTPAIAYAIVKVLTFVFPRHFDIPLDFLTALVCSIILFVVVDFANYVSHALQHFVPALWELHKVHHSATFLSPITTQRMHPLGDAFDAACSAVLVGIPMGVMGFFLHLTLADMAILLANANLVGTVIVLDALRHSHFPVSFGRLEAVFLSPGMHQLHHSCKLEHWDKNFGNKLSVWDHMFGTTYVPAKGEELVYGLGTEENHDYDKLIGVYIGPLVKIMQLATQPGERKTPSPRKRVFGFLSGFLWREV